MHIPLNYVKINRKTTYTFNLNHRSFKYSFPQVKHLYLDIQIIKSSVILCCFAKFKYLRVKFKERRETRCLNRRGIKNSGKRQLLYFHGTGILINKENY